MKKQPNFTKGMNVQGSTSTAAGSTTVTTSVVSMPKTKYGQSGGKRKKR